MSLFPQWEWQSNWNISVSSRRPMSYARRPTPANSMSTIYEKRKRLVWKQYRSNTIHSRYYRAKTRSWPERITTLGVWMYWFVPLAGQHIRNLAMFCELKGVELYLVPKRNTQTIFSKCTPPLPYPLINKYFVKLKIGLEHWNWGPKMDNLAPTNSWYFSIPVLV